MPEGEPRLRVLVVDERGRRTAAPGLAAWLARAAPRGARGVVSVALVSDARVRALNRTYRRKDYATDVLSFSTNSEHPEHLENFENIENQSLGDIVIARGVAKRQAREARHSERTELRILALHGLLHLLGYDHEGDAGRMLRVERRLRRLGGLREGLIERAGSARAARRPALETASQTMIPLAIFLLACAAVYLGAIESAFSALMRLSLRLLAERSNRPGALGSYLDDPLLLFIPTRLLLGLVTGMVTALLARAVGVEPHSLTLVILSLSGFVLLFELLIPLAIVGRDPERVLEVLLPTFEPIARALGPMTRWIARMVATAKRVGPIPTADEAAEEANEVAKAYIDTAEQEGLIEGEERRLLQSIVDFGDTLVREVMTPRPDIVAVRDTATVGDVRALFSEQEFRASRSTRTASITSPASSSSRISSRSVRPTMLGRLRDC